MLGFSCSNSSETSAMRKISFYLRRKEERQFSLFERLCNMSTWIKKKPLIWFPSPTFFTLLSLLIYQHIFPTDCRGIRRRYLRKLNFQLGLLLGLFFNFLLRNSIYGATNLSWTLCLIYFWCELSIVVGETLNGKIFLMLDNAGSGRRRFFPWAICFLESQPMQASGNFLSYVSSRATREEEKLEMIAICDRMKARILI